MAANNTDPIFTGKPDVQWGTLIATQNTAKDGTGTIVTVFTADTTNGGYIEEIRFVSAGTNIQTVARLFVNNGSTNATAGNNSYIDNITLPASTNSETSQLPVFTIPIRKAFPPGYKINITLGTTVSAGYYVTGFGGNYTRST